MGGYFMNDVRRNMFNHESNENLDLELQDKGPSHKDRCHKKRGNFGMWP